MSLYRTFPYMSIYRTLRLPVISLLRGKLKRDTLIMTKKYDYNAASGKREQGMAFVTSGFSITLSVIDTQNQLSRLTYKSRETLYADVVAQVAGLITAFNAVSDSVVSGYTISATAVEDALALPASADNQVVASISYKIVGKVRGGALSIPAPKEAIFEDTIGVGNGYVDVSNVDVVAYADQFKSTGGFTISDGDDLAFLVDGVRTTARRRTRRRR